MSFYQARYLQGSIWFTTKVKNREKHREITSILSINWFAHSCLLLADGTDTKGFIFLFLLPVAETTDWLCPKFSPSSLSMSFFPGSFSSLRNWRQRDLDPKVQKFSCIFCWFKWVFSTAEYNCLGIDSFTGKEPLKCCIAMPIYTAENLVWSQQRENDATCKRNSRVRERQAGQKLYRVRKEPLTYQKISFNSSVTGQLQVVGEKDSDA